MPTHETQSPFPRPRILITAGPTREPIDDVRFLGNRSSGSLGIELARAAAALQLDTTLVLGESVQKTNITGVGTIRFDQTSELQSLLRERMPTTDILVMAAAVADHTPRTRHRGKLSRSDTGCTTLELIATPDLLAEVSARARPDQLLVGFALEPADRLETSARRKLERKRVDLIVANPLETMEADAILATLIATPATARHLDQPTGRLPKRTFAEWLLPQLLACHRGKAQS